MSVAIKFENISKQYRLGLVSTNTISHDLNRWWQTTIRGKEDPYLKIGDINDRATKAESDYIWALKDINLEVQQGDVLGIIGKNGSGKSTLLKILSKITSPTTGTISHTGRIAALLEVGTGFHPEMTGRENIYLNGAILGMTKAEITRKLDEIVDFSGIERYIDTPAKRYSSGMYVRLGFAIAAHLDPEIMIVDEVLAVGDAEFQKKAIGKMQDVSKGEGRTVLFVSHNMTAVKNLCKTGVLLKNGTVDFAGNINDVVDYYLTDKTIRGLFNNEWKKENAPGTDKIKVIKAYVSHDTPFITVNTPFEIITEFWIEEEGFPVNVSMVLWDKDLNCVFNISTIQKPLSKGLHKATFHIPAHIMNDGYYIVQNYFVTESTPHFIHNNANSFEIVEDRESSGWHGKWIGAVRPTFLKTELTALSIDLDLKNT